MRIYIDWVISDALSRFGKDGDGTYECVSFSVSGNDLTESKIYRFCKNIAKSDAATLLPEKTLESIDRCTNGNVTLFEFSEKERYKSKRYRVSYSVQTHIPTVQRDAALADFYSCFCTKASADTIAKTASLIEETISPLCSAVTQIGIEVDSSGTVDAVKSYYSLRPHKAGVNRIGQFPHLCDICDTIDKLWKEFGLSDAKRQILLEKTAVLEGYCYYPFLFGINDAPGGSEYKIYYNLYPKEKYRDEYVSMETELLTGLGIAGAFHGVLSDSLGKINSLGQCIRGFGLVFSKNADTEINIYFGNS